MRSNFSPWDFIKSNPEIIPSSSEGIFAIASCDPFIEKIIIDRMNRGYFKAGLIPVLGSDLTPEWIENNLLTYDMFGGSDSYLVLHADDISTMVKNYIVETKVKVEGRHLVLCFSKGGTLFEKLSKELDGEFVKINPPKFWEGRKLLDFLCEEKRVRPPYEVSTYLLGALSSEDSTELVQALNMIKLHFADNQNISIDRVKELITASKLDNFKLATLFGQKKLSDFWNELISLDNTFDQLRGFFSFMEGHLFKMYDPSYTGPKGKLSKYDQEILTLSRKWQKDELLKSIRLFSEYEIMAKSKDQNLIHMMRLQYVMALE